MQDDTPQLHFRRVTDADLATLHEWIHRPHVAAWWDTPVTREEIAAEYSPALEDDTMVPHFLAFDTAGPIGFIQSYVARHAGDGWWPHETDPGVRGIDQFLVRFWIENLDTHSNYGSRRKILPQ